MKVSFGMGLMPSCRQANAFQCKYQHKNQAWLLAHMYQFLHQGDAELAPNNRYFVSTSIR